jgi:cobalt/nickel transport system permease protein
LPTSPPSFSRRRFTRSACSRGLGLVLALAGREWLRILRRACLAILLFNLVVTLSYAAIAGVQGRFSLDYVVLVNLRVVLLTCMTFLFVSRVNPFEALAFSRSLTYLFTLAYGQSMAFKQVLDDFRLAFKSRRIEKLGLRDRYRHSARVARISSTSPFIEPPRSPR